MLILSQRVAKKIVISSGWDMYENIIVVGSFGGRIHMAHVLRQ